jgi:DNA anti-recombination protein RmuC
MPEPNGTARLDRIEKILEMFIADHDRFRQGIKDLLRAQVLQADEIDKLWKTVREHSAQIAEHSKQLEEQRKQREHDRQQDRERSQTLEERLDNLVIAIGELIRSRSV